MKKAIVKLGVFLLAVLLPIGCSSDDEPINEKPEVETPTDPDPEEPENPTTPSDSMVVEMLPQTRAIELTQEQKAFVAMNNDFSFNLYRAIQAADNKKSNITSPLSVAYVLGMLNNGATSITAKEIAKVLGFGDGDKQAINNYCKALIEQAPITDPSVTLQIANIVAANQNVNLEDTYKKNVTDYYSAEMASLDFSQKSSVDYLNGWCNEKSMGMIPEIIENLNPQDLLVLMNAVYFKATWTKKFDEKETKDEAFTLADGTSTKLPMMHCKALIRYCSNDIYSGISLSFGSGDKWDMKVLLPEKGKTVDDIINNLTSNSWGLNFGEIAIVDIKIPRFTTKSDVTLNDMIAKLGAPSIFDSQKADFSLISKNQKQFFVSQIKQKAAIEVSEEGTKTTTVTVERGNGFAPLELLECDFHANRPFVYIIQEASSNVVFFIGTFQGN